MFIPHAMDLYHSIVNVGKKLIVAGGLLAILSGCESESVNTQESVKNDCLTPELRDCLEKEVSNCGTDYECISLCQDKCSSYLPSGCEIGSYGPY